MVIMSKVASLPQPRASKRVVGRTWAVGALALAVPCAIWFGLPDLGMHARIAFITFALAVIGWVFTKINDTYIALAAALVFTLSGIDEPDEFFEALGDSTVWLLLASFVIAAAVTASGLSHRLTLGVARRVRSVNQLFYALTAVLLLTAFVIPATSGRAALMVPIFVALSAAINDKRIVKALALLFPTVILLSAVASLIGAGAHLVTAEILARMGGERIGFAEWLMLGFPFAAVSCFTSTWVITRLFLNADERKRPLRLRGELLRGDDKTVMPTGTLSRDEWFVLGVVGVLMVLWSTESLHGLDNTIVALLGALVVTAPNVGVISFKDGAKSINWLMLIFMAATLELGEALIESGGAEWLVESAFGALGGSLASSAPVVLSGVIIVSLLSHLVITSRTARSSVLVPLVVLLGVSLGYNPTTLAFVSTAAAGFCLTLPVSAKPVAMFSQLKEPTYEPKDLLRLSSFLLPLHLVLLLGFAFLVWPTMGLSIARTTSQTPPAPPSWYENRLERVPAADDAGTPTPTPTPWAIFGATDHRRPTTDRQAVPTVVSRPDADEREENTVPPAPVGEPENAMPVPEPEDAEDAAPAPELDDAESAPQPEDTENEAPAPQPEDEQEALPVPDLEDSDDAAPEKADPEADEDVSGSIERDATIQRLPPTHDDTPQAPASAYPSNDVGAQPTAESASETEDDDTVPASQPPAPSEPVTDDDSEGDADESDDSGGEEADE
jgi:solute carrier family 13 (sodium-dependent dicarboxylate transporter), member 2/3/5